MVEKHTLIDDDIGKLIRKNLEETEITKDMVVYSQRTLFVYGNENNALEFISIEEFLVKILSDMGPITRDTLVSLTNIPRTTLYDTLVKLIKKGEVEKKPIHIDKRGRPKVLFYTKK